MSSRVAGYRFDTLPTFVGTELPVGEWLAVEQSRIDQFADCTGDRQWIHVDPERCALESPFRVPIAHGFLTLSLLAKELMDLGLVPPDATRAINAGVNNVRFRTPVRAGCSGSGVNRDWGCKRSRQWSPSSVQRRTWAKSPKP